MNQPAAPDVSEPEPTSVPVAGSQVGRSVWGPPVHGVGVLLQ